jgi:hypothetical protein
MADVQIAESIGQWVEIEEEDRIVFLHAKCVEKLEAASKLSSYDCRQRFIERLRISRSRRGSPLKHECDPEASTYWKCVKVDGRSQWVEADWSSEPPRLWGFCSDSEDSDDEFPKRKVLPKVAATLRHEPCQPIDVQPKKVSLGETTFCEYSTDEWDLSVRFGADSFLDQEESKERARSRGFGGLTTIESSKETMLRRKMWAPVFKSHDCGSCIERQLSFDAQDERRVPVEATIIKGVPEGFVVMNAERERSEVRVETADELERGEESSGPRKKPVDDGKLKFNLNAATTTNAPRDIKPLPKSSIQFAAITVIKESPANHLPTLKIFPDFCTASRPIFRPEYRKQITGL